MLHFCVKTKGIAVLVHNLSTFYQFSYIAVSRYSECLLKEYVAVEWRRRKVWELDSSITIQKLMGPIYEERLLLDDPLYALEVHLKICMWIMNTMHYCVLLSLYQDSSITYLSDCYLLLQEVWQHLCWTVLMQRRLCREQNFKSWPKIRSLQRHPCV